MRLQFSLGVHVWTTFVCYAIASPWGVLPVGPGPLPLSIGGFLTVARDAHAVWTAAPWSAAVLARRNLAGTSRLWELQLASRQCVNGSMHLAPNQVAYTDTSSLSRGKCGFGQNGLSCLTLSLLFWMMTHTLLISTVISIVHMISTPLHCTVPGLCLMCIQWLGQPAIFLVSTAYFSDFSLCGGRMQCACVPGTPMCSSVAQRVGGLVTGLAISGALGGPVGFVLFWLALLPMRTQVYCWEPLLSLLVVLMCCL